MTKQNYVTSELHQMAHGAVKGYILCHWTKSENMYWSKLLVADELLKKSPEEWTKTRRDVAGSCTERAWKMHNNLSQWTSKF
jgi:hypothetical protein